MQAIVAAACLAAAQARLDYPGVVEYHRVARIHEAGQVAEGQVFQPAARRLEMQQAASAALGGGVLRDELRRQRIVELRDAHGAGL